MKLLRLHPFRFPSARCFDVQQFASVLEASRSGFNWLRPGDINLSILSLGVLRLNSSKPKPFLQHQTEVLQLALLDPVASRGKATSGSSNGASVGRRMLSGRDFEARSGLFSLINRGWPECRCITPCKPVARFFVFLSSLQPRDLSRGKSILFWLLPRI